MMLAKPIPADLQGSMLFSSAMLHKPSALIACLSRSLLEIMSETLLRWR